MIIKCTSCGSQAKLPDSKEGAKVKCPSCAHIYVARPAGAKGASRSRGEDHTSKFIVGGVVLVGGAILAIIGSGGSDAPVVPEKPKEVEKRVVDAYVNPLGWDGPPVMLARTLHQAAFSANESKLSVSIDLEGAYKFVPNEEFAGEELTPPPKAAEAEGEETDTAELSEPTEPEEPAVWETLDPMARLTFQDQLVEAVMTPLEEGAVRDWEPFDGKVEYTNGVIAIVRLKVVFRDTDAGRPDRYTQWTMKNIGGDRGTDDQWRWIHVEHWVTPEEAAASRRGLRVRAEKKTLSDGSKVYESVIRAIPFDDDVPAERRAQLTKLANDLVGDIDAPPRVRRPISEDLTFAGKAAIAPLLTKMAEISHAMSPNMDENEEDRIRLNFIHQILTDITDFQTTFAVAVQMGSTKERIESGIKQWFGWYDRKYRRFAVDDEPAADPLLDDPNFVPTTPEERRVYELARRARAAELKKEKDERN
ncbi:MAG: putative RNA-binding Zn-ribbon protein involved in translation (DUF1610 family) [Planctomycetota bacterium]|jgi:predicted RNA-binding Zn-ribbon protein involved in translation (DUF1610 family)